MKALIVEDVPETQEALRELACAAFPCIECVCVPDLGSARRLDVRAFQLALVDLSLPDGSGITLIERISLENPDCTIVVSTIHDDDEHVFAALRAGAQGYLHKDEPPELLARQLQGIREGRPPLSPAIARRILGYFHRPQKPTAKDSGLTPREREVLTRLASGRSIAAIARELNVSPYTVGDHVKNIYRKLNISSRAEAALQAKRLGLL